MIRYRPAGVRAFAACCFPSRRIGSTGAHGISAPASPRFDRPSGRHVILYDEGTEEMVNFGHVGTGKGKGKGKTKQEAVWEGDDFTKAKGQEQEQELAGGDEASAAKAASAGANSDAKAVARDGGDRGAAAASAGMW